MFSFVLVALLSGFCTPYYIWDSYFLLLIQYIKFGWWTGLFQAYPHGSCLHYLCCYHSSIKFYMKLMGWASLLSEDVILYSLLYLGILVFEMYYTFITRKRFFMLCVSVCICAPLRTSLHMLSHESMPISCFMAKSGAW